MNVLVYAGAGTSKASIRGCVGSLQALLSPYYAVRLIEAKALIEEPWAASTALLVVPGGRDVPYCAALNGAGNRRIRQYVRDGGRYLGFCAGAYYASSRCEFELGTPLAVDGARELAFYPGTSRGCAFDGFVYDSEAGARIASVVTQRREFGCYWNGGGVFVDADSQAGVRVLAHYREPVRWPGGDACVVMCPFDKGTAILSAVHPEIGPRTIRSDEQDDHVDDNNTLLAQHDASRLAFFADLLEDEFGLRVNRTGGRPRLSTLHAFGRDRAHLARLAALLAHRASDSGKLDCENDSFQLLPIGLGHSRENVTEPDNEDLDRQLKYISVEETMPPTLFSILKYLSHLAPFARFGAVGLYAETVTSSQTLLDRNFSLQRELEAGTIVVCSHQLNGRGRGGNAWVSPPGVLSFSLIVHHDPRDSPGAGGASGLVFFQYLVSLATVEAVYDLTQLELRIKWPNDVYMELPGGVSGEAVSKFEIGGKRYAKVSGSLVSTTYWKDRYIMTIGCGVNVANPHPTIALNAVLGDKPLDLEPLLARLLGRLEELVARFEGGGFDAVAERYYARWLHAGQAVTIESTGARGTVVGVDHRHGTLRVRLSNEENVGVQADGNSFDMMSGLLRTKW